ncbi:U3 snoRNP protein [Pseudocyphellaria aurata]|nr:U3 snoRNP protein [Pseudocyphellaria aurata]
MAAFVSGGAQQALKKGGTPSSRKHRFESFNQRIAKLKVNPIRRSRPIDLETDDLAPTASYLQAGLEKWKELNFSENFTNFVHEAVTLCHNLPQILHYQHEIMAILVSHIEKSDSLSLEPLLDLLGRFAHDLGVRFEKYFSKAVTLVTSLASTHSDVEVIEWSFTCLAWLFKYLSRLLVPDLRPLFHIMAPLLGREPQKLYTTTFAAEAMSFLLRKAALVYHKNQMPLNLIMDCIIEDLNSMKGPTSSCQLYQHGLMTLLVESMKGIDRRLHTCAPFIYGCLLERILEQSVRQSTKSEVVLFGVTTSLIHHADAVTLPPILDVIFDRVEREVTVSSNHISLLGELIFIVTTVRKGSRIKDWQQMIDALMSLLESCNCATDESVLRVFNAAAVIIHACPLDIIIPRIRIIMDTISSDHNAKHFLLFCNFFCKLNQGRFQDLLFPYFSKFVVSHWDNYELEIVLSIPKVIGRGGKKKFVCPDAWQQHIIKAFERAQYHEHPVHLCNAYLEAFALMSLSPITKDRITTALGGIIQQSIHSSSGHDSRTLFSFGQGLKFFLMNSKDLCLWKPDTFSLVLNLGDQYGALPPYLETVLHSVKENHFDGAVITVHPLINVLVENLHTSSHILRKLSLEILKALLEKDGDPDVEIIATALAIENSPLELQSARTVSMHIRKLSSLYKPTSSQAWIQRAIPNFCFGLLTFKLSQVCDDAILALKEICDTRKGEEIVSDIAFRWLEEPYCAASVDSSSKPKQTQNYLSKVQCSNLTQVENLLEVIMSEMKDPSKRIQLGFDGSHQLLTRKVTGASSLALRVFSAVPHVAEKRSRQLVPKFLDWAGNVTQEESLEDMKPLAEQELLKPQDQKAVLNLFSLFNNPRVLYRSSEVFIALRNQLINGDVEVQRSALKAIFTWKVQGLQAYRDNLMNLLDDSRFREELSTFLQDENTIQDDHRQDLIPILLRILYGKMISGTGAGNARRGQAVKRRAVLEALSRFGDRDLHDFVQIVLGPLKNLEILKDLSSTNEHQPLSRFNARKRLGFVNMMKDMLEAIGNRLAPFARELIEALLHCLVGATRRLSSLSDSDDKAVSQMSLLKAVRQTGIQCLTLMFRQQPVKELRPYLPTIVTELVSPRLQRFPIEMAQSVSGLLQLFSTWASSRDTVTFLTEFESSLISSVACCLEVSSAKVEVKKYILEEIFKPIVKLCRESTDGEAPHNDARQQCCIMQQVLEPNTDILLIRVGNLLKESPRKELLGSAIEFVSLLAPLINGSSQVGSLLDISTFLLDQSFHRVNPRSKCDLLKILQHFVPMLDILSSSDLQDRILRTVSSLFGYFKDRTSRLTLSQVLSVLAEKDPDLCEPATLCSRLNSFSAVKLDEPDFDERLSAFSAINEVKYLEFSTKQWQPLLYNMLYFIKDTEELAIRSNASFALRRFVETKNHRTDDEDASALVKLVLLPALRKGAFESSELVRAEYLAVMAHFVRHNPEWEEVSDMLVLLVNENEEASFFENVLHIQQHRRLRALRRLASEAQHSGLRCANVAHFFVPLIEHFVFNKAEDDRAHNLANETVLTIGALASSLEWPQFRALYGRYNGYILSKPDLGKTVIKLLGTLIDSLRKAAEAKSANTKPDIGEIDIACPEASLDPRQSKLLTTIPRPEKFTEDLSNNLIPSLLKYLHDKDESTVSLRVPVAVSAVKLIMLLPPDQLKVFLPAVLTDVCNILRSRSQESRDLSRKTLVDISTLIGPQRFGFVLRELRSALARGYQLHVLSFTVHAILVATAPIFKPGDLDYCLPQVVSVIMDDIFGATGLEKDAEEYVSRMKEVKGSKSYDSMELISKTASVKNFVHLITPLRTLLEEKLNMRLVKKIDELLRRVAVGLLRNEACQDREVLVFCYEIIQDIYKIEDVSKEKTSRGQLRNKRFLLDLRGSDKPGTRETTSSNRYKLARFSLDVLRSVLHKYDGLKTPANISGFIPIVGDALVGSNEEVQISTLRLLTTIIEVPLKELDDNSTIYIAECVKILKAQVSINSELAQAALKLVSAILRERREVEFKEIDLAHILQRLIPDLEEPDRQGVVFSFIKAIMARKVVIAEVYEVLDLVAAIMVTNQTKCARDMARSVYFQFLMDYPQGKTRFSKQLAFLVKNLDYKHQEGRQSVMEAIHLLFLKVGEDMVQAIVDAFMIPLVMVIVNDECAACREMASALLKTSLERADSKRTLSFLMLLRNWLEQLGKPLLVRAALQLYILYLDVDPKNGENELPLLHLRIMQILKSNPANNASSDWELIYFALQTISKITQIYPNSIFMPNFGPLWASIYQCLSFPHMWIKLSAAKLLGTFYADFATKHAHAEELELPLQGSGGLLLKGDEIIGATRALLALLKAPSVSDELADQSVRNLIFLGRLMGKTSLVWKQAERHPKIENSGDGESFDEDHVENFNENDVSRDQCDKTALAYVLERTSGLIRRSPLTTSSTSLIPLKASLLLLTALCTHLPFSVLEPHLSTIILPLHNLSDPTIAVPFSTEESFTTTYKALIANASETMAKLQKRMGTTEYLRVLAIVREGVKERREGRRIKRRIGAVLEPERREAEKRRKGERKRVKRKERSGEERGRRRGW